MFAHVVGAMGRCDLITEEDSGLFFHAYDKLRRPDFRIHTRKGDQFLVEVKNHHKTDPVAPHRIERKYLRSLQEYANILNMPLYFAIYWSRWNLWTLTRSDYFDAHDQDFTISLADAMKRNEMALVGDYSIGTVPPLSLRIYADPESPRNISPNGQGVFRIGRVCLCADGKEIVDKAEQAIAWFLMLYGKWLNIQQPAKLVDNQIEYFDIEMSPEQRTDNQSFEIVGWLSQMLSNRYRDLTTDSTEISMLSPRLQPTDLCVVIPHDYKGQVLRLWRFIQAPNYKDIVPTSAV